MAGSLSTYNLLNIIFGISPKNSDTCNFHDVRRPEFCLEFSCTHQFTIWQLCRGPRVALLVCIMSSATESQPVLIDCDVWCTTDSDDSSDCVSTKSMYSLADIAAVLDSRPASCTHGTHRFIFSVNFATSHIQYG